ncbi:MAG: peptidoglycan editing factor PgeF [Cyanobacteriota bacterium]|jgi:YfiH family protein
MEKTPRQFSSLWRWREAQGRPYLTCALLDPWPHGFFTRQWAPETPETLAQALAPDTSVFRVKQVHGAKILSPGALPTAAETFSPADGLLSDGSNQSLWVASADCTPVLIADLVTGRVAALHAGWRGTAQGIIPKAVHLFLAQGSQLSDLRAALGPAIAPQVYQVDREVGLQVVRSISPTFAEAEAEELLAEAQIGPDAPLWPDPEPGKVRLDVRLVGALQLRRLGLKPEQIAVSDYCTYQTPESFFSYRRTGEKQVQWSGIASESTSGSPPWRG